MPIYEFKCLKCNELFELLFLNADEATEMKCPHCQSGEFERVLSSASYNMGAGKSAAQGVNRQGRSCAGGSCTTYDIPGPDG